MKDLNAIKNKLNDKDYLNKAVNAIADTFCNKCSNIRDLHIPQLTDEEREILHGRPRPRHSEKENADLINFILAHPALSVRQIACECGKPYSRIYRLFKSVYPERIKQYKKHIHCHDFILAHPELSVQDIVAIINCDKTSVYRVRRGRYGIV